MRCLIVTTFLWMLVTRGIGCPIDKLSDGNHEDISEQATVFQTKSLPLDPNSNGIDYRYMASVGNGHLATVVYSDTIYVNGLYNGVLGWSHRARIPSTQAIRTEFVEKQNCNITRIYSLHVDKGIFEEVVSLNALGGRVTQRTFAHQRFTRLLVTEILVERLWKSGQDITVKLSSHAGNDSEDIDWTETREFTNDIWPSYEQNGTTRTSELNSSDVQFVYLFSTIPPGQISLRADKMRDRWIFLTSLDTDYTVAKSAFQNGLSLIQNDPAHLYQNHIGAWASKWNNGRIEVTGNTKLNKLIYGSFYYLMSFLPSTDPYMPANQFYGLSPGGLANGANWTDYQGHVFWDMETWMYPTILMFHPELAKEMLSYRIYGMDQAYDRAESGGYEGLRYPWESARTGVEVTPDICVPCRENQQHITGDIAMAARQYLSATRDISWLKSEQGYQFIKDMGIFWASRPSYNSEKGAYEINGVMPPDESAIYVNNSVYTNVLAGRSIRFARYAACLNGLDFKSEITDATISIADQIFIPFNQTSRFHPEFEGYESYNNGTHIVKQADVILLGFPLMYEMDEDVRRNDLNHYENVTNEGGPAMTWGMFAIGWLELGEEQKAAQLFEKSYSLYLREPFKVWTEARQGIGAVNFLTGMGGFLQTLFFGYGGVRLHVERLSFDPKIPPDTDGLKFLDVNYLGSRFDVLIWQDRVQINVKEVSGGLLVMTVSSTGTQYSMDQGRLIDMSRQAFFLQSSDVNECPLPEGTSCPVEVKRSEMRKAVFNDAASAPITSGVDTMVLTQTVTSQCYNTETCMGEAREHVDKYNYLIGEDGVVYEGIGPNMTSPGSTLLTDQLLQVAFLGDFKCKPPNIKALAALKRLIKCLIERGELSLTYKVKTLEQASDSSTSSYQDDGLYCAIKDWKHWSPEQASGTLRMPDCDWLCKEEIDYTVHSNGFSDLSETAYLFETDRLPMVEGNSQVDQRYMPSIGNGHIGTVIYSSSVYLNGLFNGYKGESHRAKIPSMHNIRTSLNGFSSGKMKNIFTLNTAKGVFEERQETPNVTILIRTYAHNHYTQLLVTEVRVERRLGITGDIYVQLTNDQGPESEDAQFGETIQYYDKDKRPVEGCFWKKGVTIQPETNDSQSQEVYVYWKELINITVEENRDSRTWIFISSTDSDQKKAATVFQSGLWRIEDGDNVLYDKHTRSWWQKWDEGSIEIKGNTELSKLLYSSQYYLFSTLPSTDPNHPNEQFYGVGPDDLAHGGSGHVNWLSESLVFPAIVLFHSTLGKDILSYRTHTMDGLYDQSSEEGLKYPWQSGLTGSDVTPDSTNCLSCPLTAKHVNGDIAFAAHRYLSLTRDMNWLKEGAGQLMHDIAQYWINQLDWDEKENSYSISNVTPPDIFAENVTNSGYTNYLARMAILYSRHSACLSSRNYKDLVPDEWLKMAAKIKIPFDNSSMVNLEYENFNVVGPSEVYIPDALMLNYPLMKPTNNTLTQNDLEKYAPLIGTNTSVFTWALYTIGWLQVKQITNATEAFKNTYQQYVRQPFKVWKHLPSDNREVNSVPALSAFLQTIIYGYGGIRPGTDRIKFDPQLPPNSTVLRYKGLDFLGNQLNVEIREDTVRVVNTKASEKKLYIIEDLDQGIDNLAALKEGVEVTLPRQPFSVVTSSVTDCLPPIGSVCLPVVQKSSWNAKDPLSSVELNVPANRVVVFQTGERLCSDLNTCSEEVKRLQLDHMKRLGLQDVAYNFMIGGDARVYEGRGWDRVAHFPSGVMVDTLAIGILGDFTCDSPSDLVMMALREHIKCGIERGYVHWNYTLLGERQLQDIHQVTTLEDRLLCEISELRHWEPYQHGGIFVKPTCTEKCTRPFIPPESTYQDTSDKPTVFATNRLPTLPGSDDLDFDYMASVGNGHLATVVYSPTVYVNGLYNGPTGWSHRARIPALNALRVNFTSMGVSQIDRKFALDVERAVFEEEVVSPQLHILQRTYAHQFYTRLLVTEVQVQRRPGVRGNITFNLESHTGGPSKDITFEDIQNVTDAEIKECSWAVCFSHHGRTNQAETNDTVLQDIYLYWSERPERLTLTEGKDADTWIFLTAIDQNRQVASDSLQVGFWRMGEGHTVLFDKHVEAWKLKWDRGRIEVDGDLYLSKRIYGSFYYLLSFLPASNPYITANQFYGLSPGGLANGANWTDYQGHVFWDMETWMYPTMLMFHPELAKEMLSYRIHGMEFASLRAQSGNYSGLRFPWESAFTGNEQTPDICIPCRENQIHITGDIALAARQYLTMTRDLDWLSQEKGFKFIKGMANFWRSRPTWNTTKQAYDINGVMPPDEHAQSINNSVYTNVGAKLSIHYARYAACLSGLNASEEVPDEWLDVADKLHLPFNRGKQYHPEFDGYENWIDERGVKQADAIMLGYPQMWLMSKEVRKHDLEIYEKVTNPLGPAMTWGMYAIGWLELDDEERARDLFRRSYALYVREPFKIWTEVKTGLGAVNFITGMGGFLQTLFFGYGGARVHVENLSFDPRIPPGSTALRFVGVDYLENSFNMEITTKRVTIVPTKTSDKYPLIIRIYSSGAEYRLHQGKELLLSREKFTLRTAVVSECPLPEGSSCPPIRDRTSWDTETTRWAALFRPQPATTVIIHHSHMARCFNYDDCRGQIRLLKEFHTDSFPHGLAFSDIGYHFILGEDGSVFEGRAWDEPLPPLVGNFTSSIGIAVLGDFGCNEPHENVIEAIHRLIKCGIERKKITADYKLLTLGDIVENVIPADRLVCSLQSLHHWPAVDELKTMTGRTPLTRDCDKLCDPTEPKSLEGDVPDVSSLGTVFQTHSLPRKAASDEIDFRYMASVGNGHLATIVYSDTVYINGLYNGPTGWTHRARIPSLFSIRLHLADFKPFGDRTYSLNVERAVFEERIETERVTIIERTYAHQYYNRMLLTEIQIIRQPGQTGEIRINITNNKGNDSIDINFKPKELYHRPEICPDGCSIMDGQTIIPESDTTPVQPITVVWKNIPQQIRLLPDQTEGRWVFAMTADQNRITAEQTFDDALRRWNANPDYLYNMHVKAWREKWDRGRIEIEDNTRLSKLVHGSFYYLLSSLPSTKTFVPNNQFYGLSPGGLANGANWTDYQGHVFWDMETWMYPTMLMFHPELAKEMLSYRIYSMVPTYERAKSGGHSGLRYPWEAAFSGGEVTPDICVPCRENQQHITGDIAFAARQYLSATRDLHWLKSEKGYEFIKGMAEFWKTRPEWNENTKSYDINGVMPPDEHQISINNSVYTNIGAKLSIYFARYAACLGGLNATNEIDENWIEVANKILVPFDEERQYHPEFEGYDSVTGEKKIVKQADAILTGFPQMWPMSETVRKNDLELYEKVTHPLGPAMTWGMFAIGWLELGDEEKALDMFHRSYSLYTREPFKIWTEARSGIGAVNFITGMGGFLQAVLFGYGGIRLHVESLDFDPRLIPGSSAMRFIGLNYLGNSLDIEIKTDRVQVICRTESTQHKLVLQTKDSSMRYLLKKDQEVTVPREPFTINPTIVTDCPLPEGGSCPEIVWNKSPPRLIMGESIQFSTVVIHQTGGTSCHSQAECEKRIAELGDVEYHFLIGDDGRVYGTDTWMSTTLSDATFRIGFIGDFTCEKPSEVSMAAAKRLVKCKVEMSMLKYDYKLWTMRQTKAPDCQVAYCPADRLDCQLVKWKAWNKEQVGGKFQKPDCHGTCFITDSSTSSEHSQYVDISNEPTTFQTDSLPLDTNNGGIDFIYMASVSNGHLATVVYSDTVYVNGLYNGDMGWSHRARIPCRNAIRVKSISGESPDALTRLFTLDVGKAVFKETIDTPNLMISELVYAHQIYTRVLVTEITMTRKPAAQGTYTAVFSSNYGNESIDLQTIQQRAYKTDNNIIFNHGRTITPEVKNTDTTDVYMIYNKAPESLDLKQHQDTKTVFIIMAVGLDEEAVANDFDAVYRLTETNPEYVFGSHAQAWEEKWQRGHIEVEGNLKLSKLVYGCFYYLLSFLPSTQPNSPNLPFNGLSPGGLANGANWTDYQGHVFWDMETWMYPTMLMFHPELAKEMLSYRISGMEHAYKRAKSGGYEGLRYPWEAAQTGIEVTPDICVPCRENQLHITGDIAMAAKQFMSVTKDLDWLKSEKGYTLIKDIAKFWKTRPTWSEEKQEFEIKGVMPPDEHAQNVSNSVYTNVQAQLSIYYARYMACINGLNVRDEVGDDWLHVADKLHIPFDETRMYHPEYEGYKEGIYNRGVKQADAILLGFPLMYEMSETVRRNDLVHYEKVTNAFGPAMTWGMFSIGWLELGEMNKAGELFTKSYNLYTREPFKIWTEARSGIGAVNFITGMGGFLQSVYFGYAGVRIYNEHLSFNPRLLPRSNGLRLVGMNYLENTLDILIRHGEVSITVTRSAQDNPLFIKLPSTQAVIDLELDREVIIRRQPFILASYEVSDCPYPQEPHCPPIISRRDWSSSVVEVDDELRHPVGNVVVYQIGENCYSELSCVKQVNKQSIDNQVKFNFLVGENGVIYEGRGWNVVADHSECFKSRSIAIAMVGDFTKSPPNKRGMAALKMLIKCGMEIGKINETYSLLGEKQIKVSTCTTCQGDGLLCQLMKSQRWVKYQEGGNFKEPCCKSDCGSSTVKPLTTSTEPSSVNNLFKLIQLILLLFVLRLSHTFILS